MTILSDIISKLIGKVYVGELNLYWLAVICKIKRKLDARFKVTQNDTPHYSDSVAQVPSCQSKDVGLHTKFPSTLSKLCISPFILLNGFWDLEKCFNSETIEIPHNRNSQEYLHKSKCLCNHFKNLHGLGLTKWLMLAKNSSYVITKNISRSPVYRWSMAVLKKHMNRNRVHRSRKISTRFAFCCMCVCAFLLFVLFDFMHLTTAPFPMK